MLCCACGLLRSDVSKECVAFVFKGCFRWTTKPLKIKGLSSFETSGNTSPGTQRHVAEDRGVSVSRVENSNLAQFVRTHVTVLAHSAVCVCIC